MTTHYPLFNDLPLSQIEFDESRPRRDFGTTDDERRLSTSIRDLGLLVLILVMEIDVERYVILDGHRRFIGARRAGMQTIPCGVHHELPPEEFERIRFDVQNNYRKWNPSERAEVLHRIKRSNGFRTSPKVASFLNVSSLEAI